jgi:PhnB protein
MAHFDSVSPPVFVPMLYMVDLSPAIEFYLKAFAAKVRWQIPHEGCIHVAELEIGGAPVRLHEESLAAGERSPSSLNGTSVVIHLLAQNADELMENAISAGATVLSPMQDHDYGFRQGNIRDPFGHHWCLERMDDLHKVPKMS